MTNEGGHSGVRGLLITLIDDAFNRSAWHGPNLRGAIRRVTPEQAVWRPRGDRRNIAELVVHCAYWKYAVRRRVSGGKRGSFTLKGSNWFVLPARMTKERWRSYVALLDAEHEALRATIRTAPWAHLCRSSQGPTDRPAGHVYGIALHDTYHAGQIQTLKARYKRAKSA